MQSVTLPNPLSTNALYYNKAKKGRVKSNAYKAWIREAGAEILASGMRPIKGPVFVSITVSTKSRNDIDNNAKCVLDLLESQGIIENDKLVEGLHISKADRLGALVVVGSVIEVAA